MQVPRDARELTAVLEEIGAATTTVERTLAGLDEDALRRTRPDGRSCVTLLRDLVRASEHLGKVAHAVLGHVPEGGAYAARHTSADAAALQGHLRFLREHIVSTIEQQGAAVWFRQSPDGRPLCAFAVDLVLRDRDLLAALTRAAQG